MPKLWESTIDAHRRAVYDAILDAAWSLVEQRGPMALRMSEIATTAGIGRATLYKYFPDVEAILVAHHARHVDLHLERLREAGGGPDAVAPDVRVRAVLTEYARICFHRGGHRQDLLALLHRGTDAHSAIDQVRAIVGDAIAGAAAAGAVRTDVAPRQLAIWSVAAVATAEDAGDQDDLATIVDLTMDGLLRPGLVHDSRRVIDDAPTR